MFSASDQTPTCRADQKSRSKIVSNKTLVGGLQAGKFSFVGVVRYSSFAARIIITCGLWLRVGYLDVKCGSACLNPRSLARAIWN